jgi:hypothetical protein
MSYSNLLSGFRDGSLNETLPPLWSVQLDSEDEVLKWFKAAIDTLRDTQLQRAEIMLRNRDFYASLQSMALGKTGIPRDREGRQIAEKFSKITVNQVYDLTEHWVSQMTRFAPAIAVIPPNTEYNDRIAAKLSKAFIDYLFYINDIDDILEDCARQARLFGEAYLFIEWNKAKGDYAPGVAEAAELGVRVPLKDPTTGEQILGEDKQPLYIDSKPRVGDVDYNVVLPWHVWVQPKDKWKNVEWVIKATAIDADALKAEYPNLADQIDSHATNHEYSVDYMTADVNFNEILVFEIYHKSTEFLDKGRYIKLIPGCVLENRDLGYSHGELPVCRLTNIDLPGELHGASFFQNILLLQVVLNNLYSLAYTNIALGSHLYWLVPTGGGVDVSKLRNSASVIKFSGTTPPQIANFKTVGAEIWEIIGRVEEKIASISGRQPISQGQVPPGVEAGIAMTFLEEQENQRANVDIKKHNAFIKKIARLSLAVAGDKYKQDDGRTVRIVGKNNAFSVKALEVAKLGGPYDIRVQRTTALSESKSGRLSQILALEGRFPGMLPHEQVLDMLDLANDQKYYDLATVAVQSAEHENEQMLDGQVPSAPESFEEHLVHWYSHVKNIQSSSFKSDVPPEIKQIHYDHIEAHEYFMFEKAKTNMLFKQKLDQLDGFPIFSIPIPGIAPGGPAGTGPNIGDPGMGAMTVQADAPPQNAEMAPEETVGGESADAAFAGPDPQESLPEPIELPNGGQ